MKWILIAALAASLAAPVQGVSHNAGIRESAAHAQAHPKAETQPSLPVAVQKDVERIARALEAATNKKDAADEKRRAEQDLRDQDNMAKWARDMFLVGLAEIILTAIGVIWIYQTLVATREAVGVSKTASENEIRPYVHVSGAEFMWDHIGCRITAFVQNSGQTPATFFEIKCGSSAIKPGEPRDFTVPADTKALAWSALGGNCTDSAGLMTAKFAEDARAALESKTPINFFVFGVVRYGDIFGNEYETEFAYFTGAVLPGRTTKMMRPNGRQRTFVLVKGASEQQQA